MIKMHNIYPCLVGNGTVAPRSEAIGATDGGRSDKVICRIRFPLACLPSSDLNIQGCLMLFSFGGRG